jgi:hypothetical protein
VDNSLGNGDGTSGAPWNNINSANAAVSPGDTVNIAVGNGAYTMGTLTTDGQPGNYIVYQEDPASPGAVIKQLSVNADYVWIDGLAFERDNPGTGFANTSAIFVPFGGTARNVIVTGCDVRGGREAGFTGASKSTVDYVSGIKILSSVTASEWIVMDNTFTGPYPVGVGGLGVSPGSSSHRGMQFSGANGHGHICAYNDVRQWDDGIVMGYFAHDCDMYANQVDDCNDDSTEMDDAEYNMRCWGNRTHYCRGSGISTQPQAEGPWYYLYNQMGQMANNIFKWKVPDRMVWVNNTFIGQSVEAEYHLHCYMRNNLFVPGSGPCLRTKNEPAGDTGARQSRFTVDWDTDVDYNGYDWGGSGEAFAWHPDATSARNSYSDIDSFSAAVGIDTNATKVDRDLIFDNFSISPTKSLELVDSDTNAAYQAGQIVPNLADFDFAGNAPDLGAHQRGATSLFYGPRSGTELTDRTEYWSKH